MARSVISNLLSMKTTIINYLAFTEHPPIPHFSSLKGDTPLLSKKPWKHLRVHNVVYDVELCTWLITLYLEFTTSLFYHFEWCAYKSVRLFWLIQHQTQQYCQIPRISQLIFLHYLFVSEWWKYWIHLPYIHANDSSS